MQRAPTFALAVIGNEPDNKFVLKQSRGVPAKVQPKIRRQYYIKEKLIFFPIHRIPTKQKADKPM